MTQNHHTGLVTCQATDDQHSYLQKKNKLNLYYSIELTDLSCTFKNNRDANNIEQ